MRSWLSSLGYLVLAGCACGGSAGLDARVDDDASGPRIDVGLDSALACSDLDGDGLDDSVEGAEDRDGDGLPNTSDVDSDGDGLSDTVESTAADTAPCGRSPVHCGSCGVPRFLVVDADGDGIHDGTEAENGTSACLWDSDTDGCPDDLDTDGACEDVAFLAIEGCAPSSSLVTFTVPDDGVTRARVGIALADFEARPELSSAIIPRTETSTPPGIASDGSSFLGVPPGATLSFRLFNDFVSSAGFPRRTIGSLILSDETDAAIETRAFHVYEPTCCGLPI